MSTQEIVEGIMRVHAANMNQYQASEDGDNPRCKSKVGTTDCERCGRDVRGAVDACPAIPRSQRWKINY